MIKAGLTVGCLSLALFGCGKAISSDGRINIDLQQQHLSECSAELGVNLTAGERLRSAMIIEPYSLVVQAGFGMDQGVVDQMNACKAQKDAALRTNVAAVSQPANAVAPVASSFVQSVPAAAARAVQQLGPLCRPGAGVLVGGTGYCVDNP